MKTTLPLLALAFIFTLILPTHAADWSAASSLATARYLHQAVLLASGNVLIVAGRNDTSYRASAQLYDPTTNA